MAVEFTELSPALGVSARVVRYDDVTASDLVSDPMTVTADALEIDGTETSVNRSYDKTDWSGSVV